MKKFLSVILLVCIVMSMCTVSAWADTGTATVQSTGLPYDTLAGALSAAASIDTIILSSGTFDAKSLNGAAGKTITIEGAGIDVTILDMQKKGENPASGANLTFKKVTIQEYDEEYNGISHAAYLSFQDCKIIGTHFFWSTCSGSYIGCTFIQNNSNKYNIWTYGAADINFSGCTFTSAGKSVLIYHDQKNQPAQTMNFSNCTLSASNTVMTKAAIEIDTRFRAVNLVLDNATKATGFDETSLCGNQLWNEKANNVTGVQGGQATVVKNGVKIYENKTHIIPPPDVPNPDPGTDPGTNPGVTPNNPAPAAPVVENVYYIPATDDNSNMALWSILALALLSTAFVTRKRKSEN